MSEMGCKLHLKKRLARVKTMTTTQHLPPLRLYVWEGVLFDYTDGIMFAYATSVEHARSLILEQCDWVPSADLMTQPREIIAPEAVVLWGGG